MSAQVPALTIALAGQPNVGKSTVYNLLTGGSQYVSNWPGKTSECQSGTFEFRGETLRVVDLPGTYSLSACSPEEQMAREFIIEQRPDVLLVILDAVTPERNLYLVAELLSLPAPLVVAVNRTDLAAAQGIFISTQALEAALRVPVAPIIANRGEGVHAAIERAVEIARHPETWKPNRPLIRSDHRDVLQNLETLVRAHVPAPYPPGWVALKLLEGDRAVTAMMKARLGAGWEQADALLVQNDDAFMAVAGGRYDWIAKAARSAVRRRKLGKVTLTDRLDRLATHPVWGLALLLAVMAALFGLTFALGMPLQEWLELEVVQAAAAAVPGLMVGAPEWLVSLTAHGLIAGVGTVLTLLPILALFFTGMGVLEDSGYLARAAFVMDRWMHSIGLHGKSFLPLSFSIGCNVPAVMESRIIEEPKARLITILLTPMIPCFPRLSVVVVLAPVFFGRQAFIYSLLLFALPLLFVALYGKLAHELLQGGKHNAFIMELPLYQAPQPRAILKSAGRRVVDFLQGAASIILVVSVGLWALAYFPGGEINHSYLAYLGRWMEPLGRGIGLDWRMMVAMFTSMLRSENTLSTLAVLYTAGPEQSLSTELARHVTPAAGLAFCAMQLLFVPCIATMAAVRNESKSWSWTLAYAGLRLATAGVVGILVFQAGRYLFGGS